MPQYVIAPTSTAPLYGTSSEIARIAALWQAQYRLARRNDDPLTALVMATLSTAETWRWLK